MEVTPKTDEGGSMRIEFEKEYEIEKQCVPFASIFDNNETCKEYLYQDFCEAEYIPNFNLYRRDHISIKGSGCTQKWEQGSNPNDPYYGQFAIGSFAFPSDSEREYADTKSKFEELVRNNSLDDKYCFPSIRCTKILGVLNEVKAKMGKIRNYSIDDDSETRELCNPLSNDVLEELNKLQKPEIEKSVLMLIINDNSNLNLFIPENRDRQEIETRWMTAKNNINKLFKGYLCSKANPTSETQQQRIVNEAEIRKLLSPKLNKPGQGKTLAEAETLLYQLRTDRTTIIEYARIAFIMWNSPHITTNVFFKDWLMRFYDLMGIDKRTAYKRNDLVGHDMMRLKADLPFL